jgi:glycosyltransferase involved in cell wall biosynthesis
VRLDVLVPTFRRQHLLFGLLRSVAQARVPPGLAVQIVVIDNDATFSAGKLLEHAPPSAIPVIVFSEATPGKSSALNAAIAASTADYVGLLDDDEEMSPAWFEVVHRWLNRGDWDFLGGRCLPIWPAAPPAWLPEDCSGVLGIVDPGDSVRPFGRDFPGILSGGNAVVRLPLLRSLGGFSAALGPRRTHRLLSGEDEEMYLRLLEASAKGLYVPELVVHHRIHPYRLRKAYYRRWLFWNGTAKALIAARHRQPVPYFGGAPRYVYGRALRSVLRLVAMPSRKRSATFADELSLWHLAGFIYGRRFYNGRHDALIPTVPDAPAVKSGVAIAR